MFWTRYTTLITVRHTHVSDRLSTNPSAETHFKFFKIGRWLEVQIQRYISGQFNIRIPNHSRFTACSASTEESVSNDLVLSTYNVRSKPLVNRPVFRVTSIPVCRKNLRDENTSQLLGRKNQRYNCINYGWFLIVPYLFFYEFVRSNRDISQLWRFC
jgi:hypothetical protein